MLFGDPVRSTCRPSATYQAYKPMLAVLFLLCSSSYSILIRPKAFAAICAWRASASRNTNDVSAGGSALAASCNAASASRMSSWL
ncbi:hypothetical protein D3C78_1740180 [compost metagenome]